MYPLREVERMPAAAWYRNQGPKGRALDGRQSGIDLAQVFPETHRHRIRVNHSFAGLLAAGFRPDGKRRDVVIDSTAAANALLQMTGDTRAGIEHWSKAVAAVGQGIIGFPLVDKQRSACLGHGRVYRLRSVGSP